ncbi:terminase large subunit [Ralstonia phage Hyacinthe]|uniref:Terminase large subunit n=3 Tax=Rahariannevirus raharianne TaxID=2846050 RepID=A0A7G5BBC0_9CAUD|nr:terminase large subunit [Ralstonia phage Raharianne]QMV32399.1 terminase large subunit [Ralstonia phage Albius]QMV33437.1 terminase large subunit [Ralstonia phage Hyacinthe]QMV33593.1 terminase large subunit [Ralstonia phage Raharianne]
MSQSRKTQSSDAINLTPKQANIYCWGFQPESRFRDAVCGRRFGKTFLGVKELRRAAQLAAKWNVSTEDEIWYAAPTFKQAKRVFWRRLKKAIPRSWMESRPNESECYIALRSGHVIRIVGLDSYDNLRGSGLFYVLVDEWADCPYEAWEEVLRPMLSTCKYWIDGQQYVGGHALRIGTPKGFNHCYETYVMGQPGGKADHKSWLYTSLQGGNVPESEIQVAREQMDARAFRQEYEASFENYSGRVYYGFDRRQSVKPCKFDPARGVHIGMDFNVNPMSATVFQEQDDGEIWQVDEIVIPTSNTDEMADEIVTRYGRASFEPGKLTVDHITVYPDPAGAQRRTSAQGRTDIGILRSRGFKVVAMATHPLVRDRINVVNAKIQSADGKRHMFVDTSCKQSIKCYEQLCYKEGTNDPDKEAGLDHLPDAAGYYIYGRFAYKPTHGAHVTHMNR